MEAESAVPDFWGKGEHARQVMRRVASLRETVSVWRAAQREATGLVDLFALAQEEQDREMLEHLAVDAAGLNKKVGALELLLAFKSEHDSRNAILAIHAGAGGTESQDWAEMLLRMYLRWAERRGFTATILDLSPGEEAGVKSTQVEVVGAYAYGYLKSERGNHRLVRLSPYDANHARHTSFALVEVMPEADEVDVSINPDDLRIDFFRASGAGGQNVQKTSTAVRIVHVPTGITVAVQNERSQRQNRDAAMKILSTRLMQIELEKQAAEHAKLKGEHIAAEFGSRIRSYVLHPYKQVKDHRTSYESTDPDGVLGGDIDGFIAAFVTASVGKTT